MYRSILLALGLSLSLAVALAVTPDSSQAAVASPGATSDLIAELGQGCTVSIRGTNRGNRDIEIKLTRSKVKVRGGIWKRIDKVAGTVGGACTDDEVSVPNDRQTYSESCNLDLGCGSRRRYKFEIKRGGNTHIEYFPSSNGWTTSTTINLGDLNRHF
ncbi:hypothetical protein [Rubricoccus marinus]|uniref:Uncharacterized protein n=1 Tax=Rubricoccus marinus TaxID=716817 RepID=A0A259U2Y4_9BACT|nr:hypothetical protein [Rubricoccus marinus]OZC04306.1 hypothetical protein BSZ36_15745 [Rubricoccus marinus]